MNAFVRILMLAPILLGGCRATQDVAATSYHVTRGAAVGSYKVARAVAVGSYRVASAPVHYATRKRGDESSTMVGTETRPMLPIPANQFRQRWRQPRNNNRELRPSAARAEDRAELRSRLTTRQRSHQRASHPRALLRHRRRFRQENWSLANRDMCSAHSTRKEIRGCKWLSLWHQSERSLDR